MKARNIIYILIILAIVAFLYFGFRPGGWFRGTKTNDIPKDGERCLTEQGVVGTYQNGICIPVDQPNPGNGPSGNFTS